MNTAQLKSYAPVARREFIAAVTAQAARLGITDKGAEPAKVEGDVFLVGGHAYPTRLVDPRKRLVERVTKAGFAATMEAIAYTWFNRLVALRYMELHGFLDHGYRVLSHPAGNGRPEILDHAAELELPGLDREKVVELKLAGTKDEALYRIVLIAQCNALHKAMPFLFERVGDETEMLLPSGLLQSDSLIRKMAESIDEDSWMSIEVIGWLYQFYISDKQSQVVGKVVKPEDIPAATQLFTPSWIVKFITHNSLGAHWLATYPSSRLRETMDFYAEPPKQTAEVAARIAAVTPETLNPEELTVFDPACGSGHILVEAYDLLRTIYLERGYRPRDAARRILERNLFGLDIDQRAAQLAGFALMMKARSDDRQFLSRSIKLNIAPIVDSQGFDFAALNPLRPSRHDDTSAGEALVDDSDLECLVTLFTHATTFGSLIRIPDALAQKLASWRAIAESRSQDMFAAAALESLKPLVRQAEYLARRYDVVVANPPYMGVRGMAGRLKKYVKEHFPETKSDLFACFIARNIEFTKAHGRVGLMTPQGWMFTSSYEELRRRLTQEETISCLVQPEFNAFWDSAHVTISAYTIRRGHIDGYRSVFIKLTDFYGAEVQPQKTLEAIQNRACGWLYETVPDDFAQVPGIPIAFWVSQAVRNVFARCPVFGDSLDVGNGLQTNDTGTFLRYWQEVDHSRIGIGIHNASEAEESGKRWFPYNKGGAFRKWYGNRDFVVNWEKDGHAIKARKRADLAAGKITANNSKCWNEPLYFRPSVTWSDVTSVLNSFRVSDGSLFDISGPSAFPNEAISQSELVSLLNSSLITQITQALNPTVHFTVGNFRMLPAALVKDVDTHSIVSRAVDLAKRDWDAFERSWDFKRLPFLPDAPVSDSSIESCYAGWLDKERDSVEQMRRIEQRNNEVYVEEFGLGDAVPTSVPLQHVTLTMNPLYRYSADSWSEDLASRFRRDAVRETISYAVGCMLGRYSLDEQGLVYAGAGGIGFSPARYKRFPADDDGIVPITDTEWFGDDACERLIEFVIVAWGNQKLEENLSFLAGALSPKKMESSRETLRRYFCDQFFKDHLQIYRAPKKPTRPIYWLFTSGKEKAFQCLVYLHRYNESTLARMRSEYVIPLQGKMAARIETLKSDVQASISTAQTKRLEKERAKIDRQQVELLAFDEKLRHYADKRIALDLDDGVRVNYGKFGDLLAEVRAVHGEKPEVA